MITLGQVRERLLAGSLGWHNQLGVLVWTDSVREYWVAAGAQAKLFRPQGIGPVITETLKDQEGRRQAIGASSLYSGTPYVPPIVDGVAWVLSDTDDEIDADSLPDELPLYSTRAHAESHAGDFGSGKVRAVRVLLPVKTVRPVQHAMTFSPHKVLSLD